MILIFQVFEIRCSAQGIDDAFVLQASVDGQDFHVPLITRSDCTTTLAATDAAGNARLLMFSEILVTGQIVCSSSNKLIFLRIIR